MVPECHKSLPMLPPPACVFPVAQCDYYYYLNYCESTWLSHCQWWHWQQRRTLQKLDVSKCPHIWRWLTLYGYCTLPLQLHAPKKSGAVTLWKAAAAIY
eukprot:15548-Heterococcus_DN1.PRE.2